MKKFYTFTCIILLSCCLLSQESPFPADSEIKKARYACIIGMGDYDDDTLDVTEPNVIEIANNVRKGLEEVGFSAENIIILQNPSAEEYWNAHGDFVKRLWECHLNEESNSHIEAVVFFFVGHGITYQGERYLLLRNIKKTKGSYIETLKEGAIKVNSLLEEFKPYDDRQFNLFLIESCAKDVTVEGILFPKIGKKQDIPQFLPPLGTKVIYAADTGQVAIAGIFSSSFLEFLKAPGLEIDVLASQVINDVTIRTNGGQIPIVAGNKRGQFYFVPIDSTTIEIRKELAIKIKKFMAESEIQIPEDPLTEEQYDSLRQKLEQIRYDFNILGNENKKYTQEYSKKPGYQALDVGEFIKHMKLQEANFKVAKTLVIPNGTTTPNNATSNPNLHVAETTTPPQDVGTLATKSTTHVPKAPNGFCYLRTKAYTCGKKTHRMHEYQHKATGLEFVYIPGSTFWMGSESGEDDERPIFNVTLSPYFISKTEVTQKVWNEIMGNNPSYFQKNSENPVENISWNQCQIFCEKVGLRLPTEAQWEYASRGGEDYKYGNNIVEIGKYAWYDKNAGKKTHPVGQLLPNAYGLYDMMGNVWEWCFDRYDYYSEKASVNPSGPDIGYDRVFRGGSYIDPKENCRISNRNCYQSNHCSPKRGFRVVYMDDADCKNTPKTTIPNTCAPKLVPPDTNEPKLISEKIISPQATENSHDLFFEGFEYLGTNTYSCHDQTHTMQEYKHKATGMEFVYIPGGTFWMGSKNSIEEVPIHQVTLSPYLISKTEVTQEVWAKIMGNFPVVFRNSDIKAPVEWISWKDAELFCRKTGLCMPTEAQWEYAAFGGSSSRYAHGESEEELSKYAWYNASNYSVQSIQDVPHPVGLLSPNSYGLYDMSGNVWEFCQDRYGEYSSMPQINPMGCQTGAERVIKGGATNLHAFFCRVSCRHHILDTENLLGVGFRVVYNTIKE